MRFRQQIFNCTELTGLASAIVDLFFYAKVIWAATLQPGKCTTHKSDDGLLVANCSNNPFEGHAISWEIPTIPTSVQVIDLSEVNGQPSGFIIYNVNTFKPFSDLRRIIIKHNMQMKNKHSALETLNRNMLELTFHYIDTLEYLEFSDSYLNDHYTIHLPKNLKILNVDRNEFIHLDAHWSAELEEISANNNKLKNIPKLHFEGPPLKKLLLKGNPLDDMTVLSIAPLCELTSLELEFSAVKSYYNTEASYCSCMMLKKWAEDAKISGPQNLKCVEPQGSKPTCSEEILDKGRSLRKKCPLLKKKDAVSSSLFNIMKYTFFSILFLVLLVVAVLYVIRHFHLRELVAAHHLSRTPSPVKMEEEGEESFKNPDSLSEESDSNTWDEK